MHNHRSVGLPRTKEHCCSHLSYPPTSQRAHIGDRLTETKADRGDQLPKRTEARSRQTSAHAGIKCSADIQASNHGRRCCWRIGSKVTAACDDPGAYSFIEAAGFADVRQPKRGGARTLTSSSRRQVVPPSMRRTLESGQKTRVHAAGAGHHTSNRPGNGSAVTIVRSVLLRLLTESWSRAYSCPSQLDSRSRKQ